MYRTVVLIFLSFLTISCGRPGFQADSDDNINYRDRREPEGDTDHLEGDIEEITDDPEGFVESIKQVLEMVWDDAQECESSIPNIPLSEFDFLFTIFGKTSPMAVGRECIIERLEEASSRLCAGQRDIYDAYQAYSRGYDERSNRIRRAYENTLRMEDNFRNRLLDYADSLYDRSARSSNDILSTEFEAIATVMEQEGEFECADRIENYERMRLRR